MRSSLQLSKALIIMHLCDRTVVRNISVEVKKNNEQETKYYADSIRSVLNAMVRLHLCGVAATWIRNEYCTCR